MNDSIPDRTIADLGPDTEAWELGSVILSKTDPRTQGWLEKKDSLERLHTKYKLARAMGLLVSDDLDRQIHHEVDVLNETADNALLACWN